MISHPLYLGSTMHLPPGLWVHSSRIDQGFIVQGWSLIFQGLFTELESQLSVVCMNALFICLDRWYMTCQPVKICGCYGALFLIIPLIYSNTCNGGSRIFVGRAPHNTCKMKMVCFTRPIHQIVYRTCTQSTSPLCPRMYFSSHVKNLITYCCYVYYHHHHLICKHRPHCNYCNNYLLSLFSLHN